MADSGSAIFGGYEREYHDLSASVTRGVALVPGLSGEEKKQKIVACETEIAEAEALIRRMDLEVRSLPVASKTPLMAKLRDYKADLNKLKRECRKAATAVSESASRDELLSAAELGDSHSATSSSQRDRLLQATDRVRATGDRITEGKRTLLETEELGVSILQDLHRQRQTIVHARDTLHGADDNIARSRRILAAMGRRAMTNKLILAGIILLLLGCIGVIVYFKMIKS